MSKESEIMREHIRTHRTVLSMCNEPEDVILNRLLDDFDNKDRRIAELEEQLANSIRPKFKIDEAVFIIYGKTVKEAVIDEIYWTSSKNNFEYYTRLIYGVNDVQYETIEENELFATKEEAQAKLEELGE